MSWFNLALLAIAGLSFLAAGALAKAYTLQDSLLLLGLALTLYTVGNVLVIQIMRQVGLGVSISLITLLQLIAANAIGILYYGERLSGLQYLGLGLGVLSFCLIAFAPSTASS